VGDLTTSFGLHDIFSLKTASIDSVDGELQVRVILGLVGIPRSFNHLPMNTLYGSSSSETTISDLCKQQHMNI
jgi:hypothetical protein